MVASARRIFRTAARRRLLRSNVTQDRTNASRGRSPVTKTDQRAPAPVRDLILTRIIDAPREKLYRAWTEPELLKQWFAPWPFTTPVAELDVRAGGANFIVMRGPDGVEMPNTGVYLEVVPNERLVFTNAYSKAWEPSEK